MYPLFDYSNYETVFDVGNANEFLGYYTMRLYKILEGANQEYKNADLRFNLVVILIC